MARGKNTRKNLSDAVVKRIRKKAIAGETFTELGEEFGIHSTFARSIALGQSYANVEGPLCPMRTKPRSKPGTYKARSKKATKVAKAATNGRMPDMTTLPVDEVLRILQALSAEWPKVRASFMLLDAILGGHDDGS